MIFQKGTIRSHSSEILFLFRLLDMLAVFAVGLIAYYAAVGTLPPGPVEKLYLVLAVVMFAALSEWLGLYLSRRDKYLAKELNRVSFIGTVMLVLLLTIHHLVVGDNAVTHGLMTQWLSQWLVALTIVQIVARYGLRRFLSWARSRGWNQRHVVLVGANKNTKTIALAVDKHPEFGIQIAGYFDDRIATRDEMPVKYGRLGAISDLAKYVDANKIDQVWIAYPFSGEGRGKQVVNELRHSTVNIRYILDPSAFTDSDKTLTEFGGLPLLDIDVSPLEGLGYYVKLLEDKVLAGFALLILAPLFVVLAIGVKLSSPGPVFYRQERISWNNKPFMMLKFRSMPVDVEKNSGPKWASKGENRATKFGSFLRKTSLDELPQFINVFKGDMSIIGPRPERTVFVNQFKDQIPTYMKKHMVKAGITGWAQVNGLRGDTDLQKRIEYDLFYIKHWSLMFDLRIALKTIRSGLINENAY